LNNKCNIVQKKQIMSYIENLEWRYATKRMNGSKIDATKRERILEAIKLAPTSLGMQPFDVFVIEDAATKELLAPLCYNQPQVKESDFVLVFANWTANFAEKMELYMQNIMETRSVTSESLDGFRKSIQGFVLSKNTEEQTAWASDQAYIALGFALMAAALEHVDATPMEGFNRQAVSEFMGLPEIGMEAGVLMAVGHRDEANDYLVKAPKVRRKHEDIIRTFVK
jgi:nitroreductase